MNVLDPLMCLRYIDDIHKSSPNAAFNPFVDDTELFYANKNIINQLKNNINVSHDNMANWLKAKKLTPNVEKSKLLYFDLSPVYKRNVFDVY